MPAQTLEREFHEEMLNLYRQGKEEGYSASALINMVHELGGVAAAKKLINDPQPSNGFPRLFLMGRLDLTVEYVVAHESRYRKLFTQPERLATRRRYDDYKRKRR
jgi:hypothetical protein